MWKKVFLKIFQYTQENTCVGVFLINLQPWTCFPMNIAKILRKPILMNICERLLMSVELRGISIHGYTLNLFNECAKFRGSRAILGLVPSCLRGSENFSCGYFVGLKYFLVGISWVQYFFSWVLRGSKNFSRRYFVGQRFSLVGSSWVQKFIIFNKHQ